MITASNLTKRFGDKLAVDSLSFEMTAGEVLGFLGPNGAGKTTTMRMLTCYFPPTSGSATVAGFDIYTDSKRIRQNIGYLPELVPLHPEMTPREFVGFAAAAKGVPHADRKRFVEEALDRCNLMTVSNQVISQLSRGFRQRVGLAQAIVNKPKVLILDEPTVGLDPAQILDIRALIRDIAEHSTVLLSTHILPEVEAICSKVIIISGGAIRALDTPENLTKSLSATQRILLEVDGVESADAAAQLAQLTGVVEVHSSGPNSYHIEVPRDQDPRPEIARMVVEKGWRLLTLQNLSMKLEDIFLQVVTKERLAQAEEAQAVEPIREEVGGPV
ncbi:ATP-binding cassette domain-containing protein [bacterium]|nr:ATP-binding cassette domain-containing protein [bacterium]